MSKIKNFFAKINEQLKDPNGRKKFIKNSLKFLPAVILLIFYIVLISTEDYDGRTVLVMTAFIVLLFAVPTVKLFNCAPLKHLFSFGFFFIAPPFIFMVVEAFTRELFWALPGTDTITLLNVIFYYVLQFLVLTITTRTDVAVIVTAVIPSILGIANNISLQTRDLPIYPWDIFSARTALSVVGNYQLTISPTFKFCIFSLAAVIVFAIQLNMRLKFKKRWIGIFPVIVSVMMFCGYVSHINNIFRDEETALQRGFFPWLFHARQMYHYNGTPITFIYTLKFLEMSPPPNYDADNIKDLHNEYFDAAKEDYEKKESAKKPNVIIIMNEALSDLSVVGNLPVNKDYMPYIHSLMESNSIIYGNSIVSVKGGNTANSEFEFLTGASMAFFPAETIPYQLYIEGNTNTMVAQMNKLGYRTIGMHNFYKNGWERNEVYEFFGFDETYFIEDMYPIDQSEMIRSYMSDSAMYKRIIDMFENKSDDEPFFLFGITMQNHGSYQLEFNKSFVPEIKAEYEKKYYGSDWLDNYLSLIYESDKAYRELIEYFSTVEEETIILMYGDHQPNDSLSNPIYKNNGIIDDGSIEFKRNRYITPYLIWSNYELNDDLEAPSEVSLNYLGGIVLDLAGIPLTPFQIWQKELIKEYPTINAFSYTDASGKLNSAAGIQKIPMLNMLSQIQYNLIFDRKHTVKEFFLPVTP